MVLTGFIRLVTYNTVLARPTEHARLNGLLGMSYAIGLILGPVIGGAFAENEHATWRWVCVIFKLQISPLFKRMWLVEPQ